MVAARGGVDNVSQLEETYSDQEFCKAFKINRATSARWRDQGIVSFLKLPNGQIRYRPTHIDELKDNFERMATLGLTLKDFNGPVKGGVVHIGITKSGNNGSVAQDA